MGLGGLEPRQAGPETLNPKDSSQDFGAHWKLQLADELLPKCSEEKVSGHDRLFRTCGLRLRALGFGFSG